MSQRFIFIFGCIIVVLLLAFRGVCNGGLLTLGMTAWVTAFIAYLALAGIQGHRGRIRGISENQGVTKEAHRIWGLRRNFLEAKIAPKGNFSSRSKALRGGFLKTPLALTSLNSAGLGLILTLRDQGSMLIEEDVALDDERFRSVRFAAKMNGRNG